MRIYKKNTQIFGHFKKKMYLCSRFQEITCEIRLRTDFATAKKHRGVEQLVARQAHNLEVARSNPASATLKQPRGCFSFLHSI